MLLQFFTPYIGDTVSLLPSQGHRNPSLPGKSELSFLIYVSCTILPSLFLHFVLYIIHSTGAGHNKILGGAPYSGVPITLSQGLLGF